MTSHHLKLDGDKYSNSVSLFLGLFLPTSLINYSFSQINISIRALSAVSFQIVESDGISNACFNNNRVEDWQVVK
jgi:hypothetical protein